MNKKELISDNVDKASSHIDYNADKVQKNQSDANQAFELSPHTRFTYGILATICLLATIVISWNSIDTFELGLIGGILSLTIIACITQNRIGQFAGSIVAIMIVSYFLWNFYSLFPIPDPLFSFSNIGTIAWRMLPFVFFGLPALRYVLNVKFGFGKGSSDKKSK